jgi:hypothetical protein
VPALHTVTVSQRRGHGSKAAGTVEAQSPVGGYGSDSEGGMAMPPPLLGRASGEIWLSQCSHRSMTAAPSASAGLAASGLLQCGQKPGSSMTGA